MPYREYLTWRAFLGEQWNAPTKSDQYAAQTALEIRRVFYCLTQQQKPLSLKDLFLKFTVGERAFSPQEEAGPSEEQKGQWAKAKWLGWISFNRGKKKKRPIKDARKRP